MEILDENKDMIAFWDEDWLDWTSTCKSCNALGTDKCELPDLANPDFKFNESGCRYQDKCASCTKLGTKRCCHPDIATKDTIYDDIPCNDDEWEEVNQLSNVVDELEGFDDLDLFDEDKSLRQVLADNGLDDENEEYRVYSPDNKGCSKEHPFIINESVGFISLEKELIQYLMAECPNRNVEFKFVRQAYTILGEQHFDKLVYEVTDKVTKTSHIEEYWFDITAGMLKPVRNS